VLNVRNERRRVGGGIDGVLFINHISVFTIGLVLLRTRLLIALRLLVLIGTFFILLHLVKENLGLLRHGLINGHLGVERLFLGKSSHVFEEVVDEAFSSDLNLVLFLSLT
jgi:hypothetical protein